MYSGNDNCSIKLQLTNGSNTKGSKKKKINKLENDEVMVSGEYIDDVSN